MIEFKGDMVTLMDLSRRYQVPWTTLDRRYKKGLRGDDLVNTPRRGVTVNFENQKVTLLELSRCI